MGLLEPYVGHDGRVDGCEVSKRTVAPFIAAQGNPEGLAVATIESRVSGNLLSGFSNRMLDTTVALMGAK